MGFCRASHVAKKNLTFDCSQISSFMSVFVHFWVVNFSFRNAENECVFLGFQSPGLEGKS